MNYEFPFITNIIDVLPAIDGRDEFQELACQKYNSLASIGFNVRMNEGRTIFNLPVTIVPHMQGVLII